MQASPAPTETAAEVQQSIVDSFQFLEDWTERYQYLIELGRQLPPFPDEERIEDNRMEGCQAGVWFLSDYNDGRLHFTATSDAAIVSGLIALLLKVYSGRHPDQILEISPAFIDETGLGDHLSPHRANGLALMVERIRTLAKVHASPDLAAGAA